jgi:hypothetical protein
VTNTPAYYNAAAITALKRVIVKAHGIAKYLVYCKGLFGMEKWWHDKKISFHFILI